MTRHPVGAFAGLACLISWSWWVPLAVRGDTVATGVGWPTHLPGLAGPLLAALLVTWWVEGGAGLRRFGASMLRWRVGWWWLAVVAILLAGVAGLLVAGKGLGVAGLTTYPGVAAGIGALPTVLVVLVVNGFGEEAGWRGFAVRRLLRTRSLTATSLIVAALWAVWHLPLFFLMESFRAFGAGTIVGWVLGLTAGSFVLTWLFRGAGGSVLLVAGWHTAFNLTSATPAASGTVAAITSTLVMVAAVVILILDLRGRGAGPAVPDRAG